MNKIIRMVSIRDTSPDCSNKNIYLHIDIAVIKPHHFNPTVETRASQTYGYIYSNQAQEREGLCFVIIMMPYLHFTTIVNVQKVYNII